MFDVKLSWNWRWLIWQEQFTRSGLVKISRETFYFIVKYIRMKSQDDDDDDDDVTSLSDDELTNQSDDTELQQDNDQRPTSAHSSLR